MVKLDVTIVQAGHFLMTPQISAKINPCNKIVSVSSFMTTNFTKFAPLRFCYQVLFREALESGEISGCFLGCESKEEAPNFWFGW